MFRELKRLVREEDGMEFLEMSFLVVIAALAAGLLWGKRAGIEFSLSRFGSCHTYDWC